MEGKKIAFLLGAGASHGHILTQKTPPIMSNFLSSSVYENVLTRETFPEFVDYCQQVGKNANLLDACKSIESGSNLEKFLGDTDNPWVLHLGLFYIVRFIGTFCNQNISCDSAYVKLAKYVQSNQKNIAGIINLNYDTLFDQALSKYHLSVNYGFQKQASNAVLYIKPHGSLNFRVLYNKYIGIDCKNWEEFIIRKDQWGQVTP